MTFTAPKTLGSYLRYHASQFFKGLLALAPLLVGSLLTRRVSASQNSIQQTAIQLSEGSGDCSSCPTITQWGMVFANDDETTEEVLDLGKIFHATGDTCEHSSHDRLQIEVKSKNGFFADIFHPEQPITKWDANAPPKEIFFHYHRIDTHCVEPVVTLKTRYSDSGISSRCSTNQFDAEVSFYPEPHMNVDIPQLVVCSDGIGRAPITEKEFKAYEYGRNCSGMVPTDQFRFSVYSHYTTELYLDKNGEHVSNFTQTDLKAGLISLSANCTTGMDEYGATIVITDEYGMDGFPSSISARCVRPISPFVLLFSTIGSGIAVVVIGVAGTIFCVKKMSAEGRRLEPLVQRILTDKCPITQNELLELYKENPDSICITPNMHAFDRAALVSWLDVRSVNPYTNEPLQRNELRQLNWMARRLINSGIKKLASQEEQRPLLSRSCLFVIHSIDSNASSPGHAAIVEPPRLIN